MNLFVPLFKYLGAFAAIVLSIGLISKSGLSSATTSSDEEVVAMGFGMSNTSAATDAERRIPTYRPSDRPVSSNGERPVTRNRPGGEMPVSANSTTVSASNRATNSRKRIPAVDIEEWIQMNVAQTYLEAEKETMSPGVILATGVYFLQQGQGDLSMSVADVSSYLSDLRAHASAEAKSNMKYVANSESWFKGLNLAGFDGDRIAAIFGSHELAAFDKQMYNRYVERKVEQGDYAVAGNELAADTETANRSLAAAYNDYVERPEVREKFSLPTTKTAKPMDAREVSAGRKEAESIRPGESKNYDDPRVFWAVLQEMIALEHGYDSWETFKARDARTAESEFQTRSNIMAMGGNMTVTRRKGA